MNFTERERFYYDRALHHARLGREVFRYQALKVVTLLLIVAALIWNLAWPTPLALIIIYGAATLWETERSRRAAVAYRSVIRKLSATERAQSGHGS